MSSFLEFRGSCTGGSEILDLRAAFRAEGSRYERLCLLLKTILPSFVAKKRGNTGICGGESRTIRAGRGPKPRGGLQAAGDGRVCRVLVAEMADSGKDHGHAELIGGCDDVLIFTAPRLDDGGCAGGGYGFKAIGKGEEGVGGGDAPVRAATRPSWRRTGRRPHGSFDRRRCRGSGRLGRRRWRWI